jgi:hypothetical protein
MASSNSVGRIKPGLDLPLAGNPLAGTRSTENAGSGKTRTVTIEPLFGSQGNGRVHLHSPPRRDQAGQQADSNQQ